MIQILKLLSQSKTKKSCILYFYIHNLYKLFVQTKTDTLVFKIKNTPLWLTAENESTSEIAGDEISNTPVPLTGVNL